MEKVNDIFFKNLNVINCKTSDAVSYSPNNVPICFASDTLNGIQALFDQLQDPLAEITSWKANIKTGFSIEGKTPTGTFLGKIPRERSSPFSMEYSTNSSSVGISCQWERDYGNTIGRIDAYVPKCRGTGAASFYSIEWFHPNTLTASCQETTDENGSVDCQNGPRLFEPLLKSIREKSETPPEDPNQNPDNETSSLPNFKTSAGIIGACFFTYKAYKEIQNLYNESQKINCSTANRNHQDSIQNKGSKWKALAYAGAAVGSCGLAISFR